MFLRNGLFIKVYLCFWLITVMVLAQQIMLDRLDGSSPFGRMRNLLEKSVGICGQALLAYHQTGNREAAVRLAERFRTDNGIEAYLLDRRGDRVDGPRLPPGVREIALKAVRSGKTESFPLGGRSLVAVVVKDAQGIPYAAVARLDGKSLGPPPFLGGSRLILRVALVLSLSGFVCYLLTRYLVAPLVLLKDATRQFAAGALSVRVGKRFGKRRDETTDLAESFDAMAERIESLMKLQRQLLGDISHELRSPLARLNVALDLARRQAPPEAEHALNRIEEEAEGINALIGEVLTLTRLESGSESAPMTALDVSELVREVAKDGDFEAQGSNRGVKLLQCDRLVVNGNYELLSRAVENLVRNAIHYTLQSTEVEISVRKANQNVEVLVRDHGPGVPESEIADIFRPFYRVSPSRERQSGGCGLGLAIAERAIVLHRGSITARSATGGGLAVTMTLPLKPA